ncbi:MAG: response regulator [Nitrospiraceae bacterium]|nr:response regulator [Nitrospiraceae bacterium]
MEKILIVDDQPLICELLSSLFSSDAMVKTSENLEDAMAALCQQDFSLVISDLSLKGRNGREGFAILNYIRSKSPNTKVIIMTGVSTADTKQEALALGAAHFLAKPFDVPHILSIVNTVRGVI